MSATQNLDPDTQLVLYFTDHGDTEFDIDEFLGKAPLTITGTRTVSMTLHDGWIPALEAMKRQPGDIAAPALGVTVMGSMSLDGWRFELNGTVVPLPGGSPSGTLALPLDWTILVSGTNRLEISPVGTPGSPLVLENLELSSGPINQIDLGRFFLYLPLVLRQP
jgi:hypothetical protein